MFVRLKIYFVFGFMGNMDLFLKLRETFCQNYVKVPTTSLNYRLIFSLVPKRAGFSKWDTKGEIRDVISLHLTFRAECLLVLITCG